jgi:uncharacterized protein with PIN domain
MKVELMRQAELMVDALLEWNDETAGPTMTQIEEVILRLRKQLGEGMVRAVIEAQEAQRLVPGPVCARCGEEMRYKGMKGTRVESRVGNVELKRGYYYCETCKAGVFPPGRAVGDVGEALERAGG